MAIGHRSVIWIRALRNCEMRTQVLRGLGIANPHCLIAYGLKLELPRKLPTLHDALPAPLNTKRGVFGTGVQAKFKNVLRRTVST